MFDGQAFLEELQNVTTNEDFKTKLMTAAGANTIQQTSILTGDYKGAFTFSICFDYCNCKNLRNYLWHWQFILNGLAFLIDAFEDYTIDVTLLPNDCSCEKEALITISLKYDFD